MKNFEHFWEDDQDVGGFCDAARQPREAMWGFRREFRHHRLLGQCQGQCSAAGKDQQLPGCKGNRLIVERGMPQQALTRDECAVCKRVQQRPADGSTHPCLQQPSVSSGGKTASPRMERIIGWSWFVCGPANFAAVYGTCCECTPVKFPFPAERKCTARPASGRQQGLRALPVCVPPVWNRHDGCTHPTRLTVTRGVNKTGLVMIPEPEAALKTTERWTGQSLTGV